MVFFLLPILIAVPVLLAAVVLSVVFLFSPGSPPKKGSPTGPHGNTTSIVNGTNITTSYFGSAHPTLSTTMSGSVLPTFHSTILANTTTTATTALEATRTMTRTKELKSVKETAATGTEKSKATEETATQPTVATAAVTTPTTAATASVSAASTAKTKLDNSSSIQAPKTIEKVLPTGKGSSPPSVSDPKPTVSTSRPIIPHTRGPVSSCPTPVSHNSGNIKSPSEGYPSHQRPRQSVDTTKEDEENEDEEDEDEDDDVVLEPELNDADDTLEEGTDMKKDQKSHSKLRKHMEKRRVEIAQGVLRMPLAKPKNQEKLAKDMAKLERWIDKAVERKSARHEVNLRKALDKVLRSEEASRYLQVLQGVVLQQPSHRQRELIQNIAPVAPDNNKVADVPVPPPQNNAGAIFLGLFESLVQSVILQVRVDIRNIFMWLCAGAPECLKGRLKDFAGRLDSLLLERLSQGKEFLLQQVASVIGIPRFLILFSKGGPVEDGRDGRQPPLTEQGIHLGQGDLMFVNSQQHGPSSADRDRDRNVQDPSKEALEWVVDAFLNELKPLVDSKESSKLHWEKQARREPMEWQARPRASQGRRGSGRDEE
ncbi:MAG: hypothetical protein J3Q66DRAFT_388739 [Benniella sp.]|nr:MAG: hypothetical protein J3Q66DRAFT_388739 [Benniella sp.]